MGTLLAGSRGEYQSLGFTSCASHNEELADLAFRIDDITPEEEIALEQEAVDRAALSRAVSRPVHHGNSLPQQIMLPGGNSIPAPTSSSMDDTVQTTEEYMNICRAFIEQLRSGSAPWLLQRLNNTYGTMPTDPSEFSYWMALVSTLLLVITAEANAIGIGHADRRV